MPTLFTRHPLVLQTAYAEWKRLAREQPVLLVGTPGSLTERVVKGRRFLYRQFYDAQGKKAAEYVGGVDEPEAQERAEAIREQIERSRQLIQEGRVLARQGYVRADVRVGSILAALANHGLFRAGALLVGSHAFGALLNELGVAAASFFTEDVDIARGVPLELGLPEDRSFLDLLRDSTGLMKDIPCFDHDAPSTSWKPPGADRLRVDLLVPARGGKAGTRLVPELNTHATSLPHLHYLLEDPLDVIVMAREGAIPVRVPRPARFAWHKVLVSRLREVEMEKRSKDQRQAAILFAVLVEDAPEELEEAWAAIPSSARSKARAGVRSLLAMLEGHDAERAVEWLADVIGD
ncbi:MAG: hypothetical protein H6833_06235 [Planctomycetes bacterium]|nr:hypothetical protein [Planctomycetota bacterium]